MKEVILALITNDKALVALILGAIAGGAIIKLADPTNIITPIVTGLCGFVTGIAISKASTAAPSGGA